MYVLIVRWLQENLGSSVSDLLPCLSGQYCDCTTLSTGTRNVLPYFVRLNFEIVLCCKNVTMQLSSVCYVIFIDFINTTKALCIFIFTITDEI